MLTERRLRQRAGSSAAAEYERLKREWRHRNRRMFRLVGLVCGLVIAAMFVAGLGQARGWISGLVAGMALCFLILARETPPPWIGNHLVGAVGEERTAKAVEPLLRAGWFIAHDVGRRHFNIDHLLVGPAGAFVLETKNLSGTVVIDGDRATLTRPGFDRPDYQGDWWAREARSHAADASTFFRQRVRVRPWVTAVVVLWADFPQRVLEGDRVTFVEVDHLASWLQNQPTRLSPDQIERLRAALEPRHRRPREPVTLGNFAIKIKSKVITPLASAVSSGFVEHRRGARRCRW